MSLSAARSSVNGIVNVFNVGDAENQFLTKKFALHVTVLTGAHRRAINRLALVLIDAVLPFRISHLLVKFFGLAVLIAHGLTLRIKDRQDDCVTTAAERGLFDMSGKPRGDAGRVLHRHRNDRLVRPVHGIRRIDV